MRPHFAARLHRQARRHATTISHDPNSTHILRRRGHPVGSRCVHERQGGVPAPDASHHAVTDGDSDDRAGRHSVARAHGEALTASHLPGRRCHSGRRSRSAELGAHAGGEKSSRDAGHDRKHHLCLRLDRDRSTSVVGDDGHQGSTTRIRLRLPWRHVDVRLRGRPPHQPRVGWLAVVSGQPVARAVRRERRCACQGCPREPAARPGLRDPRESAHRAEGDRRQLVGRVSEVRRDDSSARGETSACRPGAAHNPHRPSGRILCRAGRNRSDDNRAGDGVQDDQHRQPTALAICVARDWRSHCAADRGSGSQSGAQAGSRCPAFSPPGVVTVRARAENSRQLRKATTTRMTDQKIRLVVVVPSPSPPSLVACDR